MYIEFFEFEHKFPKKTNRSKRLQKKMSLNEFAVNLAVITVDIPLFFLGDETLEDECLDMIYRHDDGCFICGCADSFMLYSEYSPTEDSKTYITNYVSELFSKLATVSDKFTEINTITVRYGDANYGE